MAPIPQIGSKLLSWCLSLQALATLGKLSYYQLKFQTACQVQPSESVIPTSVLLLNP